MRVHSLRRGAAEAIEAIALGDRRSSKVVGRSLEELENIAAIELGFAPQFSEVNILLTVEMSLGELPLILNLPFEQVLSLGSRAVQAGAVAISLATPRGALPTWHQVV